MLILTYIVLFLDSLLFNQQRHQDPMGDGSPRLNGKGKGRAPQNGDILALNLDDAEGGMASEGGAFQQMQLVEQQVSITALAFTNTCLIRR